MKKYIVFGFVLSFALAQFSCDQSVTNNYYQNGNSSGGSGQTEHTSVTTVPTEILSYTELSAFPRGTGMKLRVNRNEFEVWEVNVVFDALYTESGERLILCHTNGDFLVGAGDSGSPLLTSDGRIAGALCYGYYGNSNDFIARPIEDVLNIETVRSSLSSIPASFAAIQPVTIVAGYNAQAASRYPLLGERLAKYTFLNDQPYAVRNALAKTSLNLAIPGSSIAVMYISGDYVNQMAIGTLSYSGGTSKFAFGHSYGPFIGAPTYLASTKSFIKGINQSFKMSEPTEQLIGVFVKDDYNGILIKENAQPLVAKISGSYMLPGENPIYHQHQISNTTDFTDDNYLAANLSCYLLYVELSARNLSQSIFTAECSLSVETDRGTTHTSFTLSDRWIDSRIYYHIRDSVQVPPDSRELKSFDLSVTLK